MHPRLFPPKSYLHPRCSAFANNPNRRIQSRQLHPASHFRAYTPLPGPFDHRESHTFHPIQRPSLISTTFATPTFSTLLQSPNRPSSGTSAAAVATSQTTSYYPLVRFLPTKLSATYYPPNLFLTPSHPLLPTLSPSFSYPLIVLLPTLSP